jgi:hypothetical protein
MTNILDICDHSSRPAPWSASAFRAAIERDTISARGCNEVTRKARAV